MARQEAGARWRRRKEARPGEVLEAARAVFAERGFAAARMDDIAARAGVSKGTLYRYFAGKEDVFRALVRTAVLPNVERLEEMVAAHPGPAAAALEGFVRAIAQVMTDPRMAIFPKLIIGEGGNFPELVRFYRSEVIERALGLVAGVIGRGVAAGEFRAVDPAIAAKGTMGPLLLLAIWRIVFEPHGGRPLDVPAYVDHHVGTLLRGLAAEGRP